MSFSVRKSNLNAHVLPAGYMPTTSRMAMRAMHDTIRNRDRAAQNLISGNPHGRIVDPKNKINYESSYSTFKSNQRFLITGAGTGEATSIIFAGRFVGDGSEGASKAIAFATGHSLSRLDNGRTTTDIWARQNTPRRLRFNSRRWKDGPLNQTTDIPYTQGHFQIFVFQCSDTLQYAANLSEISNTSAVETKLSDSPLDRGSNNIVFGSSPNSSGYKGAFDGVSIEIAHTYWSESERIAKVEEMRRRLTLFGFQEGSTTGSDAFAPIKL